MARGRGKEIFILWKWQRQNKTFVKECRITKEWFRKLGNSDDGRIKKLWSNELEKEKDEVLRKLWREKKKKLNERRGEMIG